MTRINNKFTGDVRLFYCYRLAVWNFFFIYPKKNMRTSPADDFDINHFESFLCEDFLISRVTPGGLQGNT